MGRVKLERFVFAVLIGVAGCAGPDPSSFAPSAPTPHAPSNESPAQSASVVSPSAAPGLRDGVISDRYVDGLPRTVDGITVLRGAEALAKATSMTDDTSFLITGWVNFMPGIRFCGIPQPSDNAWQYCLRATFTDRAGMFDRVMTDAITFHFVREPVLGAVVVSVHVHDARADECRSAAATCRKLMVVDRIVLSGDQAVEPAPLSANAVERALERLQPIERLKAWGRRSYFSNCGDALLSAEIYFPRPSVGGVPAVTIVEVEPSASARRRALQLGAGAANALRPKAVVCSDFSSVRGSTSATDYRWLAIQNVAVLVQTHHGTSGADRAFIIRLAKALQHAARAS